jgi:hypothetical protein
VRRLPAILIVCALAAPAATGCGEGGAAKGARLTVYVSAPLRGAEAGDGKRLCSEAREQAAQGPGTAEFVLQVICLDASGSDGRWTLAKVGSNARRATEDSAAVAYIGEPDLAARRQSGPIVEAAEIAGLGGIPGREAVAKVVAALEEDDSSDPRAAIFDALGR